MIASASILRRCLVAHIANEWSLQPPSRSGRSGHSIRRGIPTHPGGGFAGAARRKCPLLYVLPQSGCEQKPPRVGAERCFRTRLVTFAEPWVAAQIERITYLHFEAARWLIDDCLLNGPFKITIRPATPRLSGQIHGHQLVFGIRPGHCAGCAAPSEGAFPAIVRG